MPRSLTQVLDTPEVRAANAAVERELTAISYAQLLRAEGDAILAARGVEIKAGIAHAVAESEAA